MRVHRHRQFRLGLLVAALSFAAGCLGWERFGAFPARRAGNAERGAVAFTESDLGSKTNGSIPRAVWEAIPVVFPDLLPEGWRGIGLLPRPGDPDGPPMGMVPRQVMGVNVYASNCALCHVGSFNGQLVVGAPNADLDIQALMTVLGTALRSPRFDIDAVARVAASKGHPLEGLERQGVRAWMEVASHAIKPFPQRDWPNAGAGRSDNLNGYKRLFGLPDDEHAAMVDLAPTFNQALKTSALADGSITGDHAARIMLTELQKGRSAADALRHREVFDDIVAFMEGPLKPPPYPFAVDATLATRGHDVYAEACASCHGSYAPDAPTFTNRRISVARVGTDPERALSMSRGMASALERTAFSGFLQIEATDAYVPQPLAGIWLTAPYLHNGSVPTLWHLLHPEARPVAFYRRWNQFDAERVGLVCIERDVEGARECAPDATQRQHDPRTLSRFDTRARGNSRAGHLYGQDLAESDKVALIEYLKTI